MNPFLSIIIPIYNEEGNIALLLERLKSVLDSTGKTYELVFVNDGSRDRSFELIQKHAALNSSIKYINFSRNFGHQIAVSAGLDLCQGQAAVIIDADLQDPPELIQDFLREHANGFQVVYGKRRQRKGDSLFKKLTAQWFYRILSWLTPIDIPLDTGDFRLIDRKVIEALKAMPEKNKFLRGQIAWIGFRQTYVLFDRDKRHAGITGYPFKKMLRFALDGIFSFSNVPLKLASWAGFVFSGVAFFIMCYALYSKFILKSVVEGWTSMILSVMFIGGIQLLCVGVIGEYIARLMDNVRNRPLYIISDTNMAKEDQS
jgi:glycosyltransferase involved in cell wall biosynthesis